MIDSIGAGDSQQADQANAATTQSTIGQEEFLNILLTQLTFQDPLKPLDNQEFIAQMAQFTNLEQTRQLSENSEVLLTMQSATQAIELLGRNVNVATSEAGVQPGIVDAVNFSQGVPVLSVLFDNGDADYRVRLADVQSIIQLQL